MNEQCLAAGTAGVVGHNGGAMTARVVDAGDGTDNVGAFVVTAVWTPL